MQESRKLVSPWQAAAATAIGSFPAAMWLMAANYDAAGQSARARKFRIAILPITLLVIVALDFVPDNVPLRGAAGGLVVAAHAVTKQQRREIAKESSSSFEPASWLTVLAVGVVSLVALVGVAFSYFFLVSDGPA